MRKSQFSCLYLVINSTFRKVFDRPTGPPDVVDIYLKMFNRVSTEHTVAMLKTKFLRIVSNSTLCPKKTVVPNFGDNFVKS